MNSSNDLLSEDTRPKIIPVTDFDFTYPRSFDELDLPYTILKYLCDKCRRPDRLQSIMMKLITASPKNLVAQARSGSGKELCSVVGMFQRLDMSLGYQPQAVLMCPTLELAKKMHKLVLDVGKYHTEFWADLVEEEDDDMDVRGYIVVGVPSTIRGLIVRGKMNLDNVKMVILDESDYMLKAGMEADILEILRAIQARQHLFQMIVFYASLTDHVRRFVPRIAPQHNSNLLFVNEEEFSVYKTSLFRIPIGGNEDDKVNSICTIMEVLGTNTDKQTVIYANPRTNINYLKQKLSNEGYKMVIAPESDDYDEYDDPLSRFKLREAPVLITRKPPGSLDQSKVHAVIFYDLPITLDGSNDDRLYYQIATKAGINCDQGCVFHLVDERCQYQMNRYQNHFGRAAKLLRPLNSEIGFSEFVDALLQEGLLKSDDAAYVRSGQRDLWDDFEALKAWIFMTHINRLICLWVASIEIVTPHLGGMKSISRVMFCVLFIMLLITLSASRYDVGIRKIEIERAFVDRFRRDVTMGKNIYPARTGPGGSDPHHH